MKKNFYYVGVCTDSKIKLVTSIERSGWIAHWDMDKKPQAFAQQIAKEIIDGLVANGFTAVIVTSLLELISQPCAEEKGGEQ